MGGVVAVAVRVGPETKKHSSASHLICFASQLSQLSQRNIQIAGSQNCSQVSPVMDTLTQVGVIFRGVQDVAGPWKEMKIIYRKSRTAENMHHPV